MAHQRKTAAEYGQLSLFTETVPEWLLPVETQHTPDLDVPAATADAADDDDDLSQFIHWLQKNRDSADSRE